MRRRRRIIAENIAANDRSAARRCSASVWRRSLRVHDGAQCEAAARRPEMVQEIGLADQQVPLPDVRRHAS